MTTELVKFIIFLPILTVQTVAVGKQGEEKEDGREEFRSANNVSHLCVDGQR